MALLDQTTAVDRSEDPVILEDAVRSDGLPGITQSGSLMLRRVLVGLDALAILGGWSLAFFTSPRVDEPLPVRLALVVGLVAAGIWLLSSARLYQARVCSVRTVEITRLARVSGVLGLVALGASDLVGFDTVIVESLLGMAATLLLLLAFRSGYRSWLQTGRREGRFGRPVILVGTNGDAMEIHHLLSGHPELGFTICAVVGDRHDADTNGLSDLWAGTAEDAAAVVQATRATGAVVVGTAISSDAMNRVTRALMRLGTHVHMTSGLRGIDHRRLRVQPLAYEPLLYLEPLSLSRMQLGAKRSLDLVLTVVALVLALPVLLLAALAIKLQDGGPVVFRQQRVGRGRKPFTIYKLRTMVPDAEKRLAALREHNEREGGPLFKLDKDPRVTRVGRLLRATSIDELPQLINVLRGNMSLVGPRPALPSEVEDFDEELLARTHVLPGITGLWQVEARDNPSFGTYRRLDLFYVENWSVTLDLVILLTTIETESARILRRLRDLFKR